MGRFKGGKNRISRKLKIICQTCNKEFEIYPYRFNEAKYCSIKCNPNLFKKEYPSWNKNKIGYTNMGSFKKGHTAYNKGQHLSKEHRENIRNAQMGEKSHRWKGGIIKDTHGYIWIKNRNHPFCNPRGYIKRSRLIMEQKIGRFLKPKEVVHHINKIRDDDRPKNLQLFKNISKHIKFHRSLKK